MTYTAQRDALLVHAKAAALATSPTWTNVAVGMPALKDSRGCRLFYGGEGEAPQMPFQGAIDGSVLIGERVALIAWWALSNLSSGALAAVDDEMFKFKHELRTRVIDDQTLGGKAIGIVMDYAEPDVVTVGGTRFALMGAEFVVSYTEYVP
jgi:hypothetical protein